jgi:peptidoglycan hydrolase-like protein with peptidoglycan-binding domain
LSALGALRWRIAALVAVILVLIGGGAWFTLSHDTAQGATKGTGTHQAAAKPKVTAPPETVVSVTPSAHSRGVNGAGTIRVVFSQPLAADSPMPSVTPSIPGSWQHVSSTTVQFVPAQGFTENTHVKVLVPGGSSGVRSAAGGQLATKLVSRFWTGEYSTMRLEQLLSQLGYLPLSWSPAAGAAAVPATDASAQISAAYEPPDGAFSWTSSGWPEALQSMWQPGATGSILSGAVMAFENHEGLAMDGDAGPQVWQALLNAVAKGDNNPNGYTYAYVSEGSPETLTIWHNGQEVEHTLANTGIPGRTTALGTYPVYLKYQHQIMKGTNPDGKKYADPVSWVSYFNGSDAVHYYPRASYGFPQSLGCVELPNAQAEQSYPYLTYGSLVTVAN